MIKCKKCLLPENFPGAKIDENALCFYCRKPRTLSNYAHEERRFLKLIENAKKIKTSEYDCIVCYSGGKDSTYTLLTAKNKYGLKPYAFTFDNGFISKTAKQNIDKICTDSDIRLDTIIPDFNQMNAIFKAVLEESVFPASIMQRLSSICHVCITYINHKALQLAVDHNINLILSGFTHGQVPKAVFPYDAIMLKKTFDETKEALSKKVDFDVNKFYPNVNFEKMNKSRTIYNVNPILFEKYEEQKIISTISRFGWKRPEDVDACSSNCLINKIGNYYHFKMYGYHPYQYELSSLIRIGSITKGEGLAMLTKNIFDDNTKKIKKKLGLKV